MKRLNSAVWQKPYNCKIACYGDKAKRREFDKKHDSKHMLPEVPHDIFSYEFSIETAMDIDYKVSADMLAQCEIEPIHIPGAIQPFGLLLTVELEKLIIHNASENCAPMLGLSAQELVGRLLGDFLAVEDIAQLRNYLALKNLKNHSPLPVKLRKEHGTAYHDWGLKAHEHLGVMFLELEPVNANGAQFPAPFHQRIQDAVTELQHATTLQDLCRTAAQQVQVITGFDRVMIYQFDTDWHGVVVAEALHENVQGYLGHYFPASDIPPQARAIFLQNWLRMIPDVGYAPAKIYPGLHPVSGEPLDLGKALLRSVSPIHLEYLKNMNVMASLTVSLQSEGRLWGLIACHHQSPLLVDAGARIGAQLIGQIVSAQLHVKEAAADIDYKAELKQVRAKLATFMENEEGVVQGLVRHAPNMLNIANAGSGAVFYRDKWTTIGTTPSAADMQALIVWLSERMPDNGIFHTDRLAKHFSDAATYKKVASGIIALQLTKRENNFVLWFRPEIAATVTWAGPPDKPVQQENGQVILHPRKSFESWTEVVSGTSAPWKEAEIEAVEALRNDILSLALQHEFKKEQAARAMAEKASREKEEMVLIVSHDLRTPLNIAGLSFEFLKRTEISDDLAVRRMIDRGTNAIEFMETLITEILDVSKIEAGTMALTLSEEIVSDVIDKVVSIAEPLAEQKGIHFSKLVNASTCKVLCDKTRIIQVLSNLIGNALKFTMPNGKVILSVDVDHERIRFCVSDTGPGIPAENLPKLFDRFWQAEETKLLGSGLGLWISKAIIEKHDGEIWATSEVGVGTNFHFSLKKID